MALVVGIDDLTEGDFDTTIAGEPEIGFSFAPRPWCRRCVRRKWGRIVNNLVRAPRVAPAPSVSTTTRRRPAWKA